MESNQLKILLARYNDGSASAEERLQLEEWYDQLGGTYTVLNDEQKNVLQNEIYAHLRENIPVLRESVVDASSAKVRAIYPALRWAAACLVIAVTVLFYFLQRSKPQDISKANPDQLKHQDIYPGGNNAILTLSDGKTIALHEIKSGKIAQQEITEITKVAEGQIVYQTHPATGKTGSSIKYNSIVTLRGGQYLVVLPDGSRVWLNAASSLRFPIAFTGEERRVELRGEAYFEISKDKHKPFLVTTPGQVVEVLGTHFNIDAYADESTVKTTLLEGSVKVSTAQSSVRLKPGQQAALIKTGNNPSTVIEVQSGFDPDEAIAWKNGKFQFNEADILTIMREISRWYDVDVIVEGKLPEGHFKGKIPKNSTLSQVLKILELNGFQFSVSGRKVIIKS